MEFKNEKWEVVEHSWSDTSIYNQDGKTICTLSIDDEETTEENQEERENEVSEIFNLIACAPEMLDELKEAVKLLYGTTEFEVLETYRKKVDEFEQLIKKATTI